MREKNYTADSGDMNIAGRQDTGVWVCLLVYKPHDIPSNMVKVLKLRSKRPFLRVRAGSRYTYIYYVYDVQPSYFYNLTYRFLTGGPAWKNSSVYSSQVSLGQVAKDSTGLGGRICSLTRLRDLENVKKGHKSMIFR